ncbi:unnamed protein product [Jaminaea pallidilutea]
MPSRTNRARNRRALGGQSDESENDDNVMATELKGGGTSAGKRSKGKGRGAAVAAPKKSKLKPLLFVLLVTTTLLALLHSYRLYTRGRGLLGIKTSSRDLEALNELVSSASSSSSDKSTKGKPADNMMKAANIPGGMVLHPTANDDDDKDGKAQGGVPFSPENKDVKIEDLDMDTLQAAFDALYGDDGPLGPTKERDEDGSYRVHMQGRKEKL